MVGGGQPEVDGNPRFQNESRVEVCPSLCKSLAFRNKQTARQMEPGRAEVGPKTNRTEVGAWSEHDRSLVGAWLGGGQGRSEIPKRRVAL